MLRHLALPTLRARWTAYVGVLVSIVTAVIVMTACGVLLGSGIGGVRRPSGTSARSLVVSPATRPCPSAMAMATTRRRSTRAWWSGCDCPPTDRPPTRRSTPRRGRRSGRTCPSRPWSSTPPENPSPVWTAATPSATAEQRRSHSLRPRLRTRACTHGGSGPRRPARCPRPPGGRRRSPPRGRRAPRSTVCWSAPPTLTSRPASQSAVFFTDAQATGLLRHPGLLDAVLLQARRPDERARPRRGLADELGDDYAGAHRRTPADAPSSSRAWMPTPA